jgi:hypothetical protein
VHRPDARTIATAAMETPPATDLDYSSHLDSDSDFGSNLPTDISDSEASHSGRDSHFPPTVLASISENSPAGFPRRPRSPFTTGQWLVVREEGDVTDAGDEEESADDVDLSASTESLSLTQAPSHDELVTRFRENAARLRALSLSHGTMSHTRATSSPSRSPTRRVRPVRYKPSPATSAKQSFYSYLFL